MSCVTLLQWWFWPYQHSPGVLFLVLKDARLVDLDVASALGSSTGGYVALHVCHCRLVDINMINSYLTFFSLISTWFCSTPTIKNHTTYGYTWQMNSSVNAHTFVYVSRYAVLHSWISLPFVTQASRDEIKTTLLTHYITTFSCCQERDNRTSTYSFIQKF